MFQESLKDVEKNVSKVFQASLVVSVNFQGCVNKFSKALRGSFKGVSKMFEGMFRDSFKFQGSLFY